MKTQRKSNVAQLFETTAATKVHEWQVLSPSTAMPSCEFSSGHIASAIESQTRAAAAYALLLSQSFSAVTEQNRPVARLRPLCTVTAGGSTAFVPSSPVLMNGSRPQLPLLTWCPRPTAHLLLKRRHHSRRPAHACMTVRGSMRLFAKCGIVGIMLS